jgi:hypothetical protein
MISWATPVLVCQSAMEWTPPTDPASRCQTGVLIERMPAKPKQQLLGLIDTFIAANTKAS